VCRWGDGQSFITSFLSLSPSTCRTPSSRTDHLLICTLILMYTFFFFYLLVPCNQSLLFPPRSNTYNGMRSSFSFFSSSHFSIWFRVFTQQKQYKNVGFTCLKLKADRRVSFHYCCFHAACCKKSFHKIDCLKFLPSQMAFPCLLPRKQKFTPFIPPRSKKRMSTGQDRNGVLYHLWFFSNTYIMCSLSLPYFFFFKRRRVFLFYLERKKEFSKNPKRDIPNTWEFKSGDAIFFQYIFHIFFHYYNKSSMDFFLKL